MSAPSTHTQAATAALGALYAADDALHAGDIAASEAALDAATSAVVHLAEVNPAAVLLVVATALEPPTLLHLEHLAEVCQRAVDALPWPQDDDGQLLGTRSTVGGAA